MSVNSKMTAIADEIRELSGTTDTMGLDDMANNLDEANTEVANQSELIADIVAALEGKAAGGSGEQAMPVINIDLNGLITATAGTKSATKQLAFQAAKTIIPSTTSQIAVSSGYYTGGDITVAGDSNLVAGNIKNGVSIFGVNGTLEEGSGSGEAAEWSENEDAIVSGTLTSYTNDRLSVIGSYTFYSYGTLTTASFPMCTNIGSYAFTRCSSLTTISFPVCTKIGNYAFSDCTSLTTVSFPACTTIGGNAFYHCSSLTTISFPVCATIGNYAFADCTSLTTVSFPACTTIGDDAFDHCIRLTTVSLPVCATIGNYAFRSCTSLTTVSFPVCTRIGYSAFYYCTSLTTVSFPMCTGISSNAFRACYNISNIQLGASSVCKLFNSNAFSATPFAGYSTYFSGTPYIYVPASLVDAYKSATNWTYFSSYISAIEDMEV